MGSSYTHYYNVQYKVLWSLYPHVQQLLPSSPSHTFQFPKIHKSSAKGRLNTNFLHKPNIGSADKKMILIQHVEREKEKKNTSRSNISSSAFQSGHMRGKDRLSCPNVTTT